MARPRAILLHWKAEEIKDLAQRLHGIDVLPYAPVSGEGMKGLAEYSVPDALVVSLDRIPSHGHAVAWHYHSRTATRHVPIVFVGGEADKVAKVREAMPFAIFCSWETAAESVRTAVANPGAVPLAAPKPISSNRPMHAKLGLKPGMRIALIGAPAELHRLVPDLDFDVDIVEEPDARTEASFWFVRSASEVDDGLAWIAPRLGPKPRLWVFYRKGKGVTWQSLSEAALPYGLAQFKILSLNAEWTGTGFGASRKTG
jgi:hypothetical protein